MKNSLIVLACFISCILSQALHAQSISIRGGITSGSLYTKTTLNGEKVSDITKSLFGYQGGITGEYNILNDLYIDASLLFLQEGVLRENLGPTGDQDVETTINTFTLPLTAIYKFPINNKIALFAETGPYFSYIFNMRQEQAGETRFLDFDEEGMKNTEYGLNFGAGLDLFDFRVGVHYMLGLADVSESDNLKHSYRTLGIYASWKFVN